MKRCLLALAVLAASSANAESLRYNYTLSTAVPYNWAVTDSIYGDWTDSGDVYGCSNWSPSTSTVGKGISFEQTATDCSQNQTRTVQPRQKDTRTGKIENSGSVYTVSRVVSASDTRDAVGILENWSDYTPTYTDWKDTNALYGCTSWSPDPSIYTATTNFTQASDTCKTDQERTRQDREQEAYTQEIRNKGTPVVEDQTLTGQKATRPYSVVLGTWTNKDAVYGCSNWSPDPSTQGKGVTFTQTASDCSQAQERTRKESYVDHQSGGTVNVAKANETRMLTGQSSTQSAVGTREDWAATTPTYTAWTNVSGKTLYSCSNWSPTGASRTATGTFTQTSTTCSTDQTRTRQDRQQEANTGEIRNSGDPVTEAQTLTGQTATRSYTVTLGSWTNSGAVTSCSNWSPDPSTVTINQTFTQTATDCQQAQTRSRVESYVDHISGSTVTAVNSTESQSVTASSTRSATGTKETWVATTSTYSAWTNSGDIYGCTAWSPSPSNYTVQTQFTQTGTGCSVAQTRTRQDRQTETTTGAIRNNGSPVTETQTATGQTTTRQYLMDFSGWADSGGYYNCSAYSPDASTVDSGTSFTQTATCSINQTRGAAGYTLVNGAWASDPAVPYRTETQVVSRAVSQTATGTKATTECRYDASNNYYHYTNAPPRVGTTPVKNTSVRWDGVTVYSSSAVGVASVSVNGYTYSASTVVSGGYGLNTGGTYYVCRSPN